MGNLLCLVQVDQFSFSIKETFRKFDVLDSGCGSRFAGHLTLKVKQLDVKRETKNEGFFYLHLNHMALIR
ncbi:hypothetical protein HanIR_Chr15g0734461 [Helianthus annuus]|nr:hypothetical protein HanIR_Chr15g0734461 [Helianthus annuus]